VAIAAIRRTSVMECHQSGLAPVSAIPVLKYLEKVVHPRWPIAFEAAKCAAVWGTIVAAVIISA